ncbi:MAG: hypothetical protein KME22_18490 [Hassallia sp. WJT32-NPBG1]|nr:hypothetical protein [Hassallia sp. WJT32-NPBG1]
MICPKPNPQAALRLFCFPYAGGSSLIFRDWYDSLPPSVELCAIELPGRGRQMQLPPFSKIEPLVDAIAGPTHHVNKNSLLRIYLKLVALIAAY